MFINFICQGRRVYTDIECTACTIAGIYSVATVLVLPGNSRYGSMNIVCYHTRSLTVSLFGTQ